MRRVLLTIFFLAILTLSGCSGSSSDPDTAGDSYFPLAVGNRWIFRMSPEDSARWPSAVHRDTISVVSAASVYGSIYYLVISSWPGFQSTGRWLYRDPLGNLRWSGAPDGARTMYLKFDAGVGQRWPIGEEASGCLTSLQLLDDNALITTPHGHFDDVREIGGGWIDCTDFGWTADFAKGVGPVRWESMTIAGSTNWLLVEAHVNDDAAAHGATDRVVDGE